jgi:hypothetical protein
METNGKQSAAADLERICADLRRENDELRRRLREAEAERDSYRKAVYALTHEELTFDKKALLAQVGKGQPLAEFIDDLERSVRA